MAVKYSASMVRAVKVLSSDLRAQAKKKGFKDNDFVFIKVGEYHSEPEYKIEKIEGSIIEFIRNKGAIVKE